MTEIERMRRASLGSPLVKAQIITITCVIKNVDKLLQHDKPIPNQMNNSFSHLVVKVHKNCTTTTYLLYMSKVHYNTLHTL